MSDKAAVVQKMNRLSLKQVGDGLKIKRVYGNRLLIKTVTPITELDRYKAAGLSIPNEAEHTPRPSTGIVIQLGMGVMHYGDHSIQEGDMVLFSKYAGADFTIAEEDFRILDINEILCTLEPIDGPVVEVQVDGV